MSDSSDALLPHEGEGEFDKENELADALYDRVMVACADAELAPDAVAYSLWVDLMRFLLASGWRPKRLLCAVKRHAEAERS